MTSLPPALLEQLLGELSTLASVYHKPPESFVGHGRYGAAEIQRAAIREQRQNAAENPIAASVAAVSNGSATTQNNAENLLDIDFDGAAPASAEPAASGSGGSGGGSNMADMMGLFDAPVSVAQSSSSIPQPSGNLDDMLGGFGAMDIAGGSSGPSTATQPAAPADGQKKEDDLLGLF